MTRGTARHVLLAALVTGVPSGALAQATYTTLDSVGNVGLDSDVAYGPNGLALISYLDSTNGNLKVAACQNLACTSAVLNTIDSSGTVGGSTSIAFGPDGRALISYQDAATASVKVARCADAICSAATRFTVEDLTALHAGTAIGVGADGRAVVAYADASTNVLRVAHCDDADCSTASITPYPGRGFLNPGLTIGGDGLALFVAGTGNGLGSSVHIGHCSTSSCTSATFLSLLGSLMIGFESGFYEPALATGTDGLGAVTFNWWEPPTVGGKALKRCSNAACAGLASPGIEGLLGIGGPTASLGFRPGNLPVIAHYTAGPFPGRLSVAFCAQVACGWPNPSPPVLPLDDVGIGRSHQLAVGPDGVGLVSYYDDANGNLKVAYLDGGTQVGIGDVAVVEGPSGTLAPAAFEVRLNRPADATVTYSTQAGTATQNVDYVAASGTLTFTAGELSRTVLVDVVGDPDIEGNEDFAVMLTIAQGAFVADGVGQGTIADDDVAVQGLPGALEHGAVVEGELQAVRGPSTDLDFFRLAQAPFASYEVVADGTAGAVNPLDLRRMLANGQGTIQSGTPVGSGTSVSLRWQNATSSPVASQLVRVAGACGATCQAGSRYRLRAYETTLRGSRFNNAGSQTTVVLLQNPGSDSVAASVRFWSPSGALLATHEVTLAAKGLLALNTSGIAALAGQSGSLTVGHDAPHGVLVGKAVALEPATGFAFDTPLEPRPR